MKEKYPLEDVLPFLMSNNLADEELKKFLYIYPDLVLNGYDTQYSDLVKKTFKVLFLKEEDRNIEYVQTVNEYLDNWYNRFNKSDIKVMTFSEAYEENIVNEQLTAHYYYSNFKKSFFKQFNKIKNPNIYFKGMYLDMISSQQVETNILINTISEFSNNDNEFKQLQLNRQGELAIHWGYPHNSRVLINAAVSLARRENNIKGLVNALNAQAFYFYKKRDYFNAITILEEAREIVNSLDNTELQRLIEGNYQKLRKNIIHN